MPANLSVMSCDDEAVPGTVTSLTALIKALIYTLSVPSEEKGSALLRFLKRMEAPARRTATCSPCETSSRSARADLVVIYPQGYINHLC